MCSTFLVRKYPGFRAVEGSGGDEGVDGWVPDLGLYFQCHAPRRSLRESNIRSYLERVAPQKPRRWVFVTNRELTRTQWRWFERLNSESGFPIEAWGPARLIECLADFPDLRDYYLARRAAKSAAINIGSQQAETITNIAAGEGSQVTVKSGRPPKVVVSVAGTVSQEAKKFGYLEYLIRQYNRFKEWQVGKPQMKYAFIRKAYEREIGYGLKFTPLDKFEAACRFLQRRIENTKLGRQNRAKGQRLYSSFDEFCMKGEDAS